MQYKITSWTGGNTPTKGDWQANQSLRNLTRILFRADHILSGIPLDYWECAGTSSLDRARILWKRAKLDAWASLPHKTSHPIA